MKVCFEVSLISVKREKRKRRLKKRKKERLIQNRVTCVGKFRERRRKQKGKEMRKENF